MISWANLDLPTESSSYNSLYNVLDFPVGVVPVTTVTLQDEEELAFYKGYYGDSNDRNFKEVSVPLLPSPPGAQTSTDSCLSPCGWVRAGWDGSGHSQGLAFITSAKVMKCHPIPEDTHLSSKSSSVLVGGEYFMKTVVYSTPLQGKSNPEAGGWIRAKAPG